MRRARFLPRHGAFPSRLGDVPPRRPHAPRLPASNQALQGAAFARTPAPDAAAARSALSEPPSRRINVAGHESPVEIHDTLASHRAARAMGVLGFSHAGRVFLGQGPDLPGVPDRETVLRHELTHAVQARRPGPVADRAALEAEAGAGAGAAARLAADPAAVYGLAWIPFVLAAGYILLKPNTANAPGPGDKTYASMTVGDYVKMTAEAAVLGGGGAVYGALRKAGFSAVASWGVSGATGSVSFRAISDIHAGEFSGIDAYVVDAFTGATIGVVMGGTFHALGKIPGPMKSLARWFRKGAEKDAAYRKYPLPDKLKYEIGQNTLPDEMYAGLSHIDDPLARGAHRVATEGWLGALMPRSTGFARPGGTLGTGPTPGGRWAIRSLFGFGSGFAGNAALGEDVQTEWQDIFGPAPTVQVVPEDRYFEWLMKNGKIGDFPIPDGTPGLRTDPQDKIFDPGAPDAAGGAVPPDAMRTMMG